MLGLSWTSLVVLSWASAALATHSSLVAEPMFGRDLEARDTVCPDSYTSKNGLNFTTYCGKNNPFNDAEPAFDSPSMQDCLEHCSRYHGDGEGCFGVVWTESLNTRNSHNCWLRNSTTSTKGLKDAPEGHSALIKDGEMNPLEESCPNSDLSIKTLPGIEGLQYTTHCGKTIAGFDDVCFSGYPKPCWKDAFSAFYHTETLEACLEICMDQHPLCKAVSWNPGMNIGFANCRLKTGFPETLTDPGPKLGIIHSATITQIDPVDRDCPTADRYIAHTPQNRTSFQVQCDQLNTGTNITTLHTQNVTACMDACATNDQNCIGVLFDSTLLGGYKNCYLQNSTNVVMNQPGTTYAAIIDADLPPTTGSGSTSSSPSPSKAWIAGPVIGGIAGVAIIGFAFFWWQRRKAATPAGVEKLPDSHAQYGVAPAYSPETHHAGQGYYDAPASEMEARTPGPGELPATTKYAHHGAHEMP